MALFALAAADDLADSRRQHVHRGDGLAVVVAAHVERLDLLRIIRDDHRLPEELLGEVALVLALQIDAPVGGELEVLARFLQQLDRFGVRDPLEAAHAAGLPES